MDIIPIPPAIDHIFFSIILRRSSTFIISLSQPYLKTTGVLKAHLLINHFIILYNVFGEAATPLLFFKIDEDLWPVVKTFVVYLGRFPDYPKTTLHDIPMDDTCLQCLKEL